ncbi:MAG TPA: hypothetical protein VHC44_19180 [Verrucomicrobiae bacterium]|nr:hypothetical protein [Verrucomicrobiae bacterium]
MPDTAPNPELLHSLGRLVRGLSALFWGLPAALIICVGSAVAGWFQIYGVVPPIAATGLLLFGLWQLDSFQKQERPWRSALDRAKVFALINLGLSPFVFWWNHQPDLLFFEISMAALAVSAWFFLFTLNTVLLRLGAMLPDETLRYETRQFTSVNHMLLTALLAVSALRVVIAHIPELPKQFGPILAAWDRGGLALVALLGLLPLAMTMALLWKTKEVIMDSVFGVKKN